MPAPREGPPRAIQLPSSKRQIESALRDEFRFHIEERIEQFVASGMTREEAEVEVRRRFGDMEAYHRQTRMIDEETMRTRNRFEFLSALGRETTRSARVLLRTPAFSAIALLTLALAIGAVTAIFTVLDAVVLRPLPYATADRLVSVLHPATVPGSGERKWGVSPGGYFFFRDSSKTLANFGIYIPSSVTIIGGDGPAEVVQVGAITHTIFDVLGARASHGRLFTAEDDLPGTPRQVVLGYEFWRRRFGGDPSVVGTVLHTSNRDYEIIGITQPQLPLPMPGPFSSAASLAGIGTDLWLLLKLDPAGPFWNNHPYVGIGLLRDGVTATEAHAEIGALTTRLPDQVPNAYGTSFMESYNFRGEAMPLKDSVLGPTLPRTLWTLFGSVLLVLLIAAANVANLFIVRMEARRHEVAIRTALGADRRHMAVHYLTESLLLTLLAGMAGIWISYAGLRALLAIAPEFPRLATVGLGWPSVAFALGTALLTGVLFGLMPLVRRGPGGGTLREDGRLTTRSRGTIRSGLVVVQLALSVVLLSSAALMIRSFLALRTVQPGFNAGNVLAFDLTLPFAGGQYDTREKALVFHRQLQERIASLPGVTSVGSVTALPLEGYATGCSIVWREESDFAEGEKQPCVATQVATPGFFESLRIPIRGRSPTWSDVDGRTQAVVVTQALADRLWPGQEAIGKGINSNGWPSTTWYRVVGVIPQLRGEAFDAPPSEAVFYAATSFTPNATSDALNYLTYVVRTSGIEPTALIPSVRKFVVEANPRVPLVNARTMEQVVANSLSRTSFVMILLGVAAGVALALSAVGTYGVISYLVTQRRPEIGVRIALGAPIRRVSGLVLFQSLRLALIGVALGLLVAVNATRLLARLLFNVSPTDPLVLTAVAALLIGIAALAALAPALRASRVDPVEVLRAG
jgi:predicted permease